MRILVTGSSGFIGTTFLEAASGREELHGLDRRPPQERIVGVEYHEVDLANPNGLAGLMRRINPEAIVHLAAQARVDPSFTDPIGTYRDNVLATTNLMEAALKSCPSLGTFVYASSETVYGPATSYPTTEGATPNPQSPYAASKAAAELLVRGAFEGRSLIVRSGMGYGPRSDPSAQVVARFIQRALRNQPLKFPAILDRPHPTRDLNFVLNFVEGVRLALDQGATGTYNIASGKELSVLDLAKAVVRKVGAGWLDFDPNWSYRRGEEGLRTWLDISKAEKAFGYRPKVDLEEGLDRTIRWMRDHQLE